MNKFFPVIIFFALVFNLNAQDCRVKRADRFFEKQEYVKAIEIYNRLTKKEPSNHVVRRLAECSAFLGQAEEAVYWYSRLIQFEDKKPADYYAYFKVLMMMRKYKEAKEIMTRYKELKPDDSRAKRFFAAGDIPSVFMKDTNFCRIDTLVINSEESDFGPVLFDTSLYFASSRPLIMPVGRQYARIYEPYLDIFVATYDTSGLPAVVKPFPAPVNARYHDGPVIFATDGQEIYFSRSNFIYGKTGSDRQNVNRLKIIKARYKDEKWVNLEDLPFNSDEYSTAHPFMSKDGNRLYFVSDRPGGFGGTDIYFVDKVYGSWMKPVNMGPDVNTEGNEMFPFFDDKGNFYFSSDGHAGLGGMDIFTVVNDKVTNMGYPLNTCWDDFSFCMDSTLSAGYFASNRPGGQGKDDIYKVVFKNSVGGETSSLIKPEQTSIQSILLSGNVFRERHEGLSPEPMVKANIKINKSGTTIARVYSRMDGTYELKLKYSPGLQMVVELESGEIEYKQISQDRIKDGKLLMDVMFPPACTKPSDEQTP